MITDAISSDPTSPINLKLSGDTQTYGISLPEGSDLTLNLNGNELDIQPNQDGEYAGSSGTKTNGLQLLKDSEVYLKGGAN